MAARYQYSVFHFDEDQPLFETRHKAEAISWARRNYGPRERAEAIDITCYRLFVPFEEAGAHVLKHEVWNS